MNRKVLAIVFAASAVAVSCTSEKSAEPSSQPAMKVSSFPAALSLRPYKPKIDPANFTTKIDNPYYPLKVGTTTVYKGISEGKQEVNTVTVTSDTKKIMGVDCVVVRDEVKTKGELTEFTYDWYAQDLDGNVWYFGEDTKELENGKVTSTTGSWEGGVRGAQPGIVMAADPKIGLQYREEYFKGEAEDTAKVIKLDASVKVPYGSYTQVLVTEERTVVEPDILERKYYGKGVGMISERLVKGGKEVSELIDVRH